MIAQDVINPPKFEYFIPTNSHYSDINHNTAPYLLGWNWGSLNSAMDQALGINSYHDFPFDVTTDVKENILVIQPPYLDPTYKITGGYNANLVLNAHCLHLEPTINIDSTENFKPRFGDKTGAVFGWRYKTVGDTVPIGDDFSRFILYKNSVTSPTLVLKDIWKGDILKWLDYDGTFSSKSVN
jgi:hypothetical protein